MTVESASVITLTREQLQDRRLAVENTIGTMRIENMEPDDATMQILNRYLDGQIEFLETKRLLREYSRTIL